MFEEEQEYDFENFNCADEGDQQSVQNQEQNIDQNNECEIRQDHYQETIQDPKIRLQLFQLSFFSQKFKKYAIKTKERYWTLQNQQPKTKNIPHVLGYHFSKFMQKIIEKKQLDEDSLPDILRTFLGKKIKAKTVTYGLDDFKSLFLDQVSKEWFVFYLKNNSFLDLVHSNKIKNSETYILFIEHYLAGSQKPELFNSNKNQQDNKSKLKIEKQNLKKSQQADKEKERVTQQNIKDEQFELLNFDSLNLNLYQ